MGSHESLLPQNLTLETPSSTLPVKVTYDIVNDIRVATVLAIISVILFFLFYQLLQKLYNRVRIEAYNEQETELAGDISIANHGSLVSSPSDWYIDEGAIIHNNLWSMDIVNGFVSLLTDRQGLSSEDLENCLPLVNYKSLGKNADHDECAICLDDFEDDEICRVFPVCKHVFHFNCIDNWLRNHLTCPICRNCVLTDE